MMYQNPRALPSELGVRPVARLTAGFLSQAFTWMFAGLLVTAGVAWLVQTNPRAIDLAMSLYLPVVIAQLVLVVVISAAISRLNATAALLLFFVYSALMGVTLSFIFLAYDLGTISSAFLSAAAMFGGAAAYGALTNRSLAGIGGYLVMGLFGLIAATLLNGFILHSTGVSFAVSIVGVLIFVGLTAWNVQRISRGDFAAATGSMEKGAVLAALLLYLDFINIFLFLLRIFGGNRR